jgi:6-phosphogluconate dehydrogenase
MADKGFKVCAYNRTTSKVDDFLANEAKGKRKSPPVRISLTLL